MFVKEAILFLFVIIKHESYGQFVIPEITLEAYDPKGFRASIPATNGIQMFAFHLNINKDISQVDPGDYSEDLTSPSGNTWSYYNPELALKVGDSVNYWVFIQHDKLGYRKDNQHWNVTELIKIDDKPCQKTETTAGGKTYICQGSLLFEDTFNEEGVNSRKWKIEEYIPTYSTNSLDFEFVSYQNKPSVCYVAGNKLYIKPKVEESEAYVNGKLDLRERCTRSNEDECLFERSIYFIVPPVTSGRLVSRFNFKYGKIEIKAKLPSGDWIFPEMYLEQVNDPSKKLWLGYARGNDRLLASNNEDIGGSLLFGGPVLNPKEPHRTQYLKSKRNNKPYTSEMHTYTVVWKKDEISLQVDGETYGKISKKTMDDIRFAENSMVHLVLGVGAGGVNDFPDDFRSGDNMKPWQNNNNKQVKKFFLARNKWLSTWKLETDNRALQVDSVKIWAI